MRLHKGKSALLFWTLLGAASAKETSDHQVTSSKRLARAAVRGQHESHRDLTLALRKKQSVSKSTTKGGDIYSSSSATYLNLPKECKVGKGKKSEGPVLPLPDEPPGVKYLTTADEVCGKSLGVDATDPANIIRKYIIFPPKLTIECEGSGPTVGRGVSLDCNDATITQSTDERNEYGITLDGNSAVSGCTVDGFSRANYYLDDKRGPNFITDSSSLNGRNGILISNPTAGLVQITNFKSDGASESAIKIDEGTRRNVIITNPDLRNSVSRAINMEGRGDLTVVGGFILGSDEYPDFPTTATGDFYNGIAVRPTSSSRTTITGTIIRNTNAAITTRANENGVRVTLDIESVLLFDNNKGIDLRDTNSENGNEIGVTATISCSAITTSTECGVCVDMGGNSELTVLNSAVTDSGESNLFIEAAADPGVILDNSYFCSTSEGTGFDIEDNRRAGAIAELGTVTCTELDIQDTDVICGYKCPQPDKDTPLCDLGIPEFCPINPLDLPKQAKCLA